ncbi:SAM-dependent methyltransferase [Ornithinimicrobium cerasi]|uniref:Methyltransferase domain-containing protein n=1 Tax=Ornithinimicrobium cerasi TaxID=2248773 RepID=A0A285VRU7_9MICO|nr:SAM-dependent methyltransferase [Ornithinimicrobium cerasi]SOC56800.1 hypothetical protein SAMN05421879_1097 [Ornithinimicrobium cerasi]
MTEAGRSGAAPGRAAPDWLALRGPADTAARDEGAGHLLTGLVDHLDGRGVSTLEVVDVGAGRGANERYLRPRLPFRQRWVVVDHDAEHLGDPVHGDAVRVAARVRDLPARLAGLPAAAGARLVTCAALLDVLHEPDLVALARCVREAGGLALLALSVDGPVVWDPPEEEDAVVRAAFDGHQRRSGRPGPEAPRILTGLLRGTGLEVRPAPTPWRLGPEDDALLARWLDERVAAVLEHDPRLRPVVDGWHARRVAQAASGRLRVVVSHVDLLVLPR